MLQNVSCGFSSSVPAATQPRAAPQLLPRSPLTPQQQPAWPVPQRNPRAAAVAEASQTMTSSKAMDAVFPEALAGLEAVDPEVASIIEDEKARQWWVAKPLLQAECFMSIILFFKLCWTMCCTVSGWVFVATDFDVNSPVGHVAEPARGYQKLFLYRLLLLFMSSELSERAITA